MTTDRAVRIMAGSFILISLALGIPESPLFISRYFLVIRGLKRVKGVALLFALAHSFDHSRGVTSGKDIATFARPGDEKIVTAVAQSSFRRETA